MIGTLIKLLRIITFCTAKSDDDLVALNGTLVSENPL